MHGLLNIHIQSNNYSLDGIKFTIVLEKWECEILLLLNIKWKHNSRFNTWQYLKLTNKNLILVELIQIL